MKLGCLQFNRLPALRALIPVLPELRHEWTLWDRLATLEKLDFEVVMVVRSMPLDDPTVWVTEKMVREVASALSGELSTASIFDLKKHDLRYFESAAF